MIVGLLSVSTSVLQGLIYIMVGFFLMPPILIYLEKDMNIKIPTPLKYVIVVVGLLTAGAFQTSRD